MFRRWKSLLDSRRSDTNINRREYTLREGSNRLSKLVAQVATIANERWLIVAIHATFQSHFAQHHSRIGREVFVDNQCLADRVRDFSSAFPRRPGRDFTK